MTYSNIRGAMIIIATLFLCSLTQKAVSQTWYKTGNQAASYEAGGDPYAAPGSDNEGFIYSISSPINGFGSYATTIPTGVYQGKAIKLSAWVRIENVTGYSTLWMRVDGPSGLRSTHIFTRK